LEVQSAADDTSTWQSPADLFPLQPTTTKVNDERVFIGQPFGLLLRR